MSIYSFLPWARHGLGAHLAEAEGDQTVKLRASVNIKLEISGTTVAGAPVSEPLSRAVQLYGPGEIVGIDAKAIVRTEPQHWITNFEPNYLPLVEFYDEDFPWRYTPAKPTGGRRLTPWLTLVVLTEEEFTEANAQPLPFIDVPAAAEVFPLADTLWAWAHVHVNQPLTGTTLEAVVTADRDLAYSRLLSPRALAPDTGYHAFLIPSFESGRLAGLGLNPDGAAYATQNAWQQATRFPYYHRWFFRTGTVACSSPAPWTRASAAGTWTSCAPTSTGPASPCWAACSGSAARSGRRCPR
jgi:hypothetical protein